MKEKLYRLKKKMFVNICNVFWSDFPKTIQKPQFVINVHVEDLFNTVWYLPNCLKHVDKAKGLKDASRIQILKIL